MRADKGRASSSHLAGAMGAEVRRSTSGTWARTATAGEPRRELVPAGATFKFGQSPFHGKGALYLATREFFDHNIQGGFDALVSEIEEPELKAFIAQRFLPSGWYDLLPARSLMGYAARALRMPVDDYLLYRVRYQARRDLSGIHAWVLRMAPPSLVAPRLPTVLARTFDFATAESHAEARDSLVLSIHGVPVLLADWFRVVLQVYAETAMKLAGAQTVTLEPLPSTREGERGGLPLLRLQACLRWA